VKRLTEKVSTNDPDCRLNGCLFFSTTKLAREMGKLAEEAFRKTGLSPSHAVLLYIINLNGKIQQKEVGELVHLTPSTITRLLNKLEQKRFVKKKVEGKNVCLQATSLGRAQQGEIIEAWNMLHKGYQNILTEEEISRFFEISKKLLDELATKNN
jgi:DNA-binding MarR family transcriptional regulator